MTNTNYTAQVGTAVLALVSVLALASMLLPVAASAASYAYVDKAGDVKMVTATDWMTAIATAFNIHIHSGVMILNSAADFTIVGDTVPSI